MIFNEDHMKFTQTKTKNSKDNIMTSIHLLKKGATNSNWNCINNHHKKVDPSFQRNNYALLLRLIGEPNANVLFKLNLQNIEAIITPNEKQVIITRARKMVKPFNVSKILWLIFPKYTWIITQDILTSSSKSKEGWHDETWIDLD